MQPGDLLVLNDTRVRPARLTAVKKPTGGMVEILFLEETENGDWEVLLRASRRPRPGSVLRVGNGPVEATVVALGERGKAILKVHTSEPVEEVLARHGAPPLPPYIQRKDPEAKDLAMDRERYQTVYAREPGAVAAPTAGLHFTPGILDRLEQDGVGTVRVTLHVGPGTFRPVNTEDVDRFEMETERYEVTPAAADQINETRKQGHRIVAVGTTSVRTLETVTAANGVVAAGRGRTGLFIRPPYTFKGVDGLLTNFHLPCSTLLMLVSAFAGKDLVFKAYEEAVREKYRFYSYGDCMLIL
jgi:S-adenosylmethionine:tRNA ribosyltransferase-isomerase